MSRGRKPIPDELKILRGTDQPCRMSGKTNVVDKITDIKQITSCSKLKMLPTKRAKDIFKQKANQLIALNVLTELDLEQLAVYANSLDLVFDCLEGMRKPAIPKYDKEGNLTGYVAPPELALYRQMVEIVNKIGSDFGFSPISRQRINTAPTGKEETIEDLLG